MAWKKVSPEMCQLLEEALAGFEFEKKQMFGCPAYFINNNWFGGAHEDNIILKLSPEDREAVMAKYDEARLFEPMKGRKMKEMVVMPDEVIGDRLELNHWLTKAHEYVSALPPKVKKPKKKRAPKRRTT